MKNIYMQEKNTSLPSFPEENEKEERKIKYPVLTLEKALDIINYFKTHVSDEGVSLTEICRDLNMKKSSVHRILNTLYEYNYIERTAGGKRYKLSWELYYIGSTVPLGRSLSSSVCMPVINELCEKYNESINMSVLTNNEAVVIYCAEPSVGVKLSNSIGDRQPLYATAKGKLFLSQMSDKKIFDYYRDTKIERFTQNTITTPGRMLNEIYDINSCGFAMDREEHYIGITCISMPIRNFENRIVATLSCSGLTQSILAKIDKSDELKNDLRDACERLSMHMGYKPE